MSTKVDFVPVFNMLIKTIDTFKEQAEMMCITLNKLHQEAEIVHGDPNTRNFAIEPVNGVYLYDFEEGSDQVDAMAAAQDYMRAINSLIAQLRNQIAKGDYSNWYDMQWREVNSFYLEMCRKYFPQAEKQLTVKLQSQLKPIGF